jgi:hypothetical protein
LDRRSKHYPQSSQFKDHSLGRSCSYELGSIDAAFQSHTNFNITTRTDPHLTSRPRGYYTFVSASRTVLIQYETYETPLEPLSICPFVPLDPRFLPSSSEPDALNILDTAGFPINNLALTTSYTISTARSIRHTFTAAHRLFRNRCRKRGRSIETHTYTVPKFKPQRLGRERVYHT